MKVGFLFVLVLFILNTSYSQSNSAKSGGSAQGSLRVTVTVAPSVWLGMEANSKQAVVTANVADPKDTFHHTSPKKQKKPVSRTGKSAARSLRQPASAQSSDPAVQFSFPTAPKEFEITRKTVMMNVEQDDKTVRKPVTVTTIVVQ